MRVKKGVRRTWSEEQMLQQEGEFIGLVWGEGGSKPWGCKDVFIWSWILLSSIRPCLFSYGYSSVTYRMETREESIAMGFSSFKPKGLFYKKRKSEKYFKLFCMNVYI